MLSGFIAALLIAAVGLFFAVRKIGRLSNEVENLKREKRDTLEAIQASNSVFTDSDERERVRDKFRR